MPMPFRRKLAKLSVVASALLGACAAGVALGLYSVTAALSAAVVIVAVLAAALWQVRNL